MGNRRMGLGRLEALLEAVDRNLDLTNTTLTAPTIVDAVSIDCAGALVVDGASTFSGATAVSGQLTNSGAHSRITKFDLGAQVSLDPQSDGTAFSGATGEISQWGFRCGNTLSTAVIGTQTLLAPALATTGLNIAGDQVNNDGWEFRGVSSLAEGVLDKDYFKVGTSAAFFMKVKFSIADVSGIDDLRCGFSQKDEAFTATTDNYTDSAWMSVISGDIKTQTIIANAATVATDLTAPSSGDWADAASHTFKIMVSAAGVVTYELDDTAPTGAVAYTFADALLVTPMWFHRFDATSPGNIIWQTFEFGLQ